MGQRPRLLDFATVRDRAEFIRNHPIGYRKDGRPIFMIAGGSGEDDDDDADDDASGGGSGGKAGGTGGDGDTVSRSEYEALQRRMRAADRAKSAAEQRAEELEAEQRSELDNAKKKASDLEKENEALKGTVQKLRLDNAFLTATDVQWVDPEAALRLVDLSDVTIGDDGKVEGLEDALKRLAEKKPYLVQKDEKGGKGKKGKAGAGDDEDDSDDEGDDTDDEDDDDTSGDDDRSGGGAQGGASGTSTGTGKRRKKSKGPTDAELMARYRI